MADIQKANWNEQRSGDQDRNSHLRLSNSIVFRSIMGIDLIGEPYTNHGGGEEPNTETEISKAGGSDAEPVSTSEEFW